MVEWVQARMSQDAQCRGCPGRVAEAKAGISWEVLEHPSKASEADVVRVWVVPGRSVPVSPW